MWILFVTVACLTAIPYTLTATGWQSGTQFPIIFSVIFLPAQALLLAGFVRHALHPGESSLESQPRWVQIIYPLGLSIPMSTAILLGLWGWDGARQVGAWWATIVVLVLTGGLVALALTAMQRILSRGGGTNTWVNTLRITWLFDFIWSTYRFLGRASNIITGALEGDGGILWSFLLLVLLLSVFIGLR